MNERFKALLSDAQRWGKEAVMEWAASAKLDPVQHTFSVALGILLALILSGLW